MELSPLFLFWKANKVCKASVRKRSLLILSGDMLRSRPTHAKVAFYQALHEAVAIRQSLIAMSITSTSGIKLVYPRAAAKERLGRMWKITIVEKSAPQIRCPRISSGPGDQAIR
ncbi:hypothetical protein D3C75_1043700 [compost metagenome]